jgi:hypothetical protein
MEPLAQCDIFQGVGRAGDGFIESYCAGTEVLYTEVPFVTLRMQARFLLLFVYGLGTTIHTGPQADPLLANIPLLFDLVWCSPEIASAFIARLLYYSSRCETRQTGHEIFKAWRQTYDDNVNPPT